MRIRKRPQIAPCSPNPLSALQAHVEPASVEGKERRIVAEVAVGGERGVREGERLHHHGDLPLPVPGPLEPPSDLCLPLMKEEASSDNGPNPGHGSSWKLFDGDFLVVQRLQEGSVDAAHKSWKRKTDCVNTSNSFGAISLWCEEVMSFPVKKQDNQDMVEKVRKVKNSKKSLVIETTTTSTTTSSDTDGDVVKEEEDLDDGLTAKGNGKSRKRRSPAVLMDGSRCSRVNGRGWRCWQQTLVGYSLCEHHLGKGRLRSMSSVRTKGNNKSNEDNHVASHKKA